MNADGRAHPVLALTAGYFFGVACVFGALWAITGSLIAALTFSLIPAAFFLPVVTVFMVASARAPARGEVGGSAERRQADIVIAVCYVVALIPFWFAAVAFLNGRLSLGLALLAVYALVAAAPLQRLLRLRIAQSASQSDGR